MSTVFILYHILKKNLALDCTNCQHLATSAFCTLKSNELTELNQYKVSSFLKKGQTIFYENDMVKGLYCVHEGKIKLYKTLNDGNVQILRIAKSADLIGYRGLVGNGRYIASAEVLEDSIVCFIPKERFFDLLATNVQFSLGMMSKIASDISEAESRAVNFIQKSSRERLAEALLLLEHSFGLNTEGYIDIKLTREEIASFTGMAVETTVRTLHGWEKEGIISLHKKYIKLVDKTELLDISNTME